MDVVVVVDEVGAMLVDEVDDDDVVDVETDVDVVVDVAVPGWDPRRNRSWKSLT